MERADLCEPGIVLTDVLRVLSSLFSEIGKEERRNCFFEGFDMVLLLKKAESFRCFNQTSFSPDLSRSL